jgi:hypothetical protein
MEDYHVFSSENLIDWKDHGVILDQKQVPWVTGTPNSMWAPDCVFKDGKYYFYFPASNRIGVAIADHPEGPFKVEPQTIVNGIDPCCLIDPKDGKAYLVWGNNALFIHKLKDNMKELDPDVQTLRVPNIPTQGLVEGPFMFERKGIYYLTFPHAVRINGHEAEELEYVISDNPLGPFKAPPNASAPATTTAGIIMDQSPSGIWTNHHSLVEYQGQWILFYHDRDLSPDFDKNRSIRADYLTFNDDGSINKVIPTLRGIGIADATKNLQIDRYSAISGKDAVTVSFLDTNKKFDGWKVTLKDKDAWVQYDRVDFSKSTVKSVNVRSQSSTGGTIEIHLDKPDGPLLAKVDIEKGTDWKVIPTNLTTTPTGTHNLVITQSVKNEVDIDWLSFQ